MSLHFILDGYNIIKRTPKLDSTNLRQSRDNLINFINTTHPQGSPRNKITIIFDGRSDILYHKNNFGGIDITFSEQESADDLIKKIILQAKNKKNICLVSDDKGLINSLKGFGVIFLTVIDFISRRDVRKNKNFEDSGNALTYSQKEKINKELFEIWVKNS